MPLRPSAPMWIPRAESSNTFLRKRSKLSTYLHLGFRGRFGAVVKLSYTFGGRKYKISREAIVAAMQTFDRKPDEQRSARRGSKYFVWWQGQPYAPKNILRCLRGGPVGSFSGGNATNQVFRDLEFYVGKRKCPERLPSTGTQVPSITNLKKKLFAARWTPLAANLLKGQTGQYPGVYLFAFSDKRLNHKRVKLDDVFYVGSSCTALNTRLNQFYSGIRRYCCHSAAMRFYKRWRRRSRPGQSFYVATVTIPCETRKELRTEKDLRKMGRVAELEYAVLAEIKKYTRFEPLLNRK